MSANDLLFKIQILIGLYLFQHPENMHDIVASTIMLPNKKPYQISILPYHPTNCKLKHITPKFAQKLISTLKNWKQACKRV